MLPELLPLLQPTLTAMSNKIPAQNFKFKSPLAMTARQNCRVAEEKTQVRMTQFRTVCGLLKICCVFWGKI
ncbi:MAG: hypothetical protein BGO01_12565 [Armatimonadetes bacterium 55-13]|nr:MAG: hypothetical protein BGO01_12565 [Armatimonadetes bacterium 55-13]